MATMRFALILIDTCVRRFFMQEFEYGIMDLHKGDITRMKVDGIVNAANSSLMGGGGVDGAIHRAGGRAILEECISLVKEKGRLPPGKAVITTGGDLRARYVIHTVGPIWHGGRNNEGWILESCYLESMKLADVHELEHIAFPSISTGAYGYPVREAAGIAVRTIATYLSAPHGSLKRVTLVLFDSGTYKMYENALINLQDK